MVCENLSKCGSLLVNETIYKECLVNNDYGTSPDKFLSYGPYKLVKLDQTSIRLVKNENWFGYKDSSDEYYQTKEIVVDLLDDYAESYSLFKEGKYEYIDLEEYLKASNKDSYDEIDKKYIKQGLAVFTSSRLLMFNQNLKGSSRILSIPEFRQALVYALDWDQLKDRFESKSWLYYYLHPFYTPKGEINKYTGEYFYSSEEFQEFFEQYCGDIDGKERAKVLLDEAYNIALDNGYLTESDVIKISFGVQGLNNGDFITNEWENLISDTLLDGKIEFHVYYYADYMNYYMDNNFNIKQEIMWCYPLYIGDLAIKHSLSIKEGLGFTDYRNKEFSITFDEIIDINGKRYENVSLITSVSNWLNGFKDETVHTQIIIDGEKYDTVTFLYSDNAKVTDKIMAECEKFIFSDYSLIPTLDTYNPIVINDNINLNYETELHFNNLDFRFITFN